MMSEISPTGPFTMAGACLKCNCFQMGLKSVDPENVIQSFRNFF